MGISNFSSADVLVGAANLLYAPRGTALPDETTVPVNNFAGWPTGWVHLGYTEDAPSFGYSYDTFEVSAQQSTSPLKRSKTGETLTVSTNLLQFSGDHLALVTGGTAVDTAAGAAQKAFTRVVGGGATNLPEHMFALEGFRADENDDLQPFRLFLWRATITANGDIAFAKDAATTIPIQISALTDDSKPVGEQIFEAHIVTGPITG